MDGSFWLRDESLLLLLGFCVGFISGFGARAMISWYRRRHARWDERLKSQKITTEPHEPENRPPLHFETFERTTGLACRFRSCSGSHKRYLTAGLPQ